MPHNHGIERAEGSARIGRYVTVNWGIYGVVYFSDRLSCRMGCAINGNHFMAYRKAERFKNRECETANRFAARIVT